MRVGQRSAKYSMPGKACPLRSQVDACQSGVRVATGSSGPTRNATGKGRRDGKGAMMQINKLRQIRRASAEAWWLKPRLRVSCGPPQSLPPQAQPRPEVQPAKAGFVAHRPLDAGLPTPASLFYPSCSLNCIRRRYLSGAFAEVERRERFSTSSLARMRRKWLSAQRRATCPWRLACLNHRGALAPSPLTPTTASLATIRGASTESQRRPRGSGSPQAPTQARQSAYPGQRRTRSQSRRCGRP